jgi:hypothetical protein
MNFDDEAVAAEAPREQIGGRLADVVGVVVSEDVRLPNPRRRPECLETVRRQCRPDGDVENLARSQRSLDALGYAELVGRNMETHGSAGDGINRSERLLARRNIRVMDALGTLQAAVRPQ